MHHSREAKGSEDILPLGAYSIGTDPLPSVSERWSHAAEVFGALLAMTEAVAALFGVQERSCAKCGQVLRGHSEEMRRNKASFGNIVHWRALLNSAGRPLILALTQSNTFAIVCIRANEASSTNCSTENQFEELRKPLGLHRLCCQTIQEGIRGYDNALRIHEDILVELQQPRSRTKSSSTLTRGGKRGARHDEADVSREECLSSALLLTRCLARYRRLPQKEVLSTAPVESGELNLLLLNYLDSVLPDKNIMDQLFQSMSDRRMLPTRKCWDGSDQRMSFEDLLRGRRYEGLDPMAIKQLLGRCFASRGERNRAVKVEAREEDYTSQSGAIGISAETEFYDGATAPEQSVMDLLPRSTEEIARQERLDSKTGKRRRRNSSVHEYIMKRGLDAKQQRRGIAEYSVHGILINRVRKHRLSATKDRWNISIDSYRASLVRITRSARGERIAASLQACTNYDGTWPVRVLPRF